MTPRKKLSDILSNAAPQGDIQNLWKTTDAASEFKPIPKGDYESMLDNIEFRSSASKGTPSVCLTFRVHCGECAGRKLWHDLYLTPAALAITKRELAKLGITELEQIEKGCPPGIVCKVRAVIQADDDGTERNRVKLFEVLRIEEPERDPFAPDESEGQAK